MKKIRALLQWERSQWCEEKLIGLRFNDLIQHFLESILQSTPQTVLGPMGNNSSNNKESPMLEKMDTTKIKQISLLQTFNMLTCVVNHRKTDLIYSVSHT